MLSCLKWFAVACLLGAATVVAQVTFNGQVFIQQQAIGIAGGGANTLQGQASNSGVYVRDSAVALDKMALARKMQRLHEWGKSADIYQEVLEKYRDRVMPSHTDANGMVDQYTSVVSEVTQELAQWPPEGLLVYRARYELIAKNLLTTAKGDDLRPLHEVFSRYFVTLSGRDAGMRLIDSYFELGEFSAAAWIGHELLLHPDIEPLRPAVLYRIGLAEHLSGDDADAAQELHTLKTSYPAAIGTVRGTDVVLADQLADDLAHIHPVDIAAAQDTWPMPGGNVSRSRIPTANVRPGARLYGVPVAKSSWTGEIADPTQRKGVQDTDAAQRKLGGAIGIIPAVDNGQLFFQDNTRLYAVDLENGLPLPEWQQTYSAHDGQYLIPDALATPIGQQLTVALTENCVVAVMDQADPSAASNNVGSSDPRLVCLDRHNGRQLWSARTHDLPDTALQTLILGSSPLVIGDNVYVTALGSKGNGYDECWVLCYDLSTGTYRWSCYIASAANASAMSGIPGQPTPDAPFGQLAYASGRLFVSTNVGAVAALDAYNGTIAWLHIYRESDENPANQMAMMGGMMMAQNGADVGALPSTPTPWTTSPPIVQGGNVFVLPDDGKYILVYDAGSGQLVKQLRKDDCCHTDQDDDPNSVLDERHPDTLLGVIPGADVTEGDQPVQTDLLVVATPCRICAIRWRDYDANHPAAALAWVSYFTSRLVSPPPGTPPAQAVRAIRGRAFVTATSILVPTDSALFRVAVRTGKIVDSFPPTENWSEDQEPGNVVVSSDYVVIAGQDHVDAYTDLQLAKQRLDKAIADAPDDPDPRLRCAEVMFVADELPLAMKSLDDAIGILRHQGVDGEMAAGPSRDRVFADSLSFATRLARRPQPQVDPINGLFDRAAAAASSASQQVSWRMARARFDQAAGDELPNAVKLYQEILADAHLRTVPILLPQPSDSNDSATTQAALAAQSAIHDILTQPGGKEAYAPFDQAAVAQFNDAKAAQDPEKLLFVSTAYPNSSVALQSLQAAADAFESRGQPRQATQTLRQIYLELPAPTPDDKARMLEAMARNYMRIPDRIDAAVSRMNQAAQLAGELKLTQPIVMPDGSTLSDMNLSAAASALQKSANLISSAQFPRFGFPSHAAQKKYSKTHGNKFPVLLTEDPSFSVAGIDALVRPLPEFSRFDRLVTWSQLSGISIYPAYATKPLGSCADCEDAAIGCAWVPPPTTRPGGPALLAWSNSRLLMLDGTTAATQWKLDVSILPSIDVMAQFTPEEPQVINVNGPRVMLIRGPNGPMRVIVHGNGRLIIRGRLVINGNVVMLPQPNAAPAPFIAESATESITHVMPVGDLALLSTSTGRVACVALSSGDVLWQMRLADHEVDRVVADDDFTVIKVTNNNNIELLVLDTLSGRMLARRAFSMDSGSYPINIALGDDGTLAYTTPDQLFIYDLYEVQSDQRLGDPKGATAQTQDSQSLFHDMTNPDQLLVHSGQVLAVCQNGSFVRGYSVQTGQLRQYDSVDEKGVTHPTPMILPTGMSGQTQTSLSIAGEYFYAWSSDGIDGYNLDYPPANWPMPDDDPPPPDPQRGHELFVGKDAVVLVDEPATAAPAPPDDQTGVAPQAAPDAIGSTSCRVRAYSRMQLPGRTIAWESGAYLLDTVATGPITDPHGFAALQAVDQGIYYLDTDHHLHVLRVVTDLK